MSGVTPGAERRVRGIVLDYGGVVWDMRVDVMAKLEGEHGLPPGSLVRTLYATEWWDEIKVGKREADGWLAAAHTDLEALAGRMLPPLHDMWRDAQHLIDENVELVRALRPPHRTAILSNASKTLVSRMTDDLKIAHLFDVLISSADVGIAKPDPAIYVLAADRLGLAAADCVFVDDTLENVDAARAAGMEAIHYRVELGHSLASRLEALGVQPM